MTIFVKRVRARLIAANWLRNMVKGCIFELSRGDENTRRENTRQRES